jgi:hypothetical protein
MDTIRERPLEGFQLGQEFLLQLVIDPGLCLLRCGVLMAHHTRAQGPPALAAASDLWPDLNAELVSGITRNWLIHHTA